MPASFSKWLQTAAVIVVVVVTAALVRGVFTSLRQADTFKPGRDTPAVLQMLKAEMDKKLPMRTDEITSLVGFDVGPEHVHYQYLIDRPSSAFDRLQFRSDMQGTLVQQFCANAGMEMFRRLNVRHTYRTSDGIELANINFTRDACSPTQ